MEEELQQIVATGQISEAEGEKLSSLKPGCYCLHKSWGFGQIREWNLPGNQVLIDFDGREGHKMQPKYAATSLQPLPEEHILVQRATRPAELKQKAMEEPIEVMKTLLSSYGGRLFADDITGILKPSLFDEKSFKKWWDSTKKLLKSDGHFIVPAKKTAPFELREKPLSRSEELVEQFKSARQPKANLLAVEEILKNKDEFEDPLFALQPVVSALETMAVQQENLHPSASFEFIVARDQLVELFPELKAGTDTMNLPEQLRKHEAALGEIIPEIPAARQRVILNAFQPAFGDDFVRRLLQLIPKSPSRTVSDINRLLKETGQQEELYDYIRHVISTSTATSDLLYWVFKERKKVNPDLLGPEVLKSAFSALEMDQLSETRRGAKLQNLIFDDLELIAELLDGAEKWEAREVLRRLKMSPAFDDLTKRSIIGRILKLHPEFQNIITGDDEGREGALIVSWGSLEGRKKEYDDLVKKKIPENSKEIAIAKEYGDLRENFEYKAAKQMQAILLRRRAELEQDLKRAKGTDFENPDTSKVSIGTTVEIEDTETAEKETFHVLGAWDGDVKAHIISYQTAMGQALMDKTLEEVVELPTEHGTTRTVKLLSIKAWKQDEAA